MNKPQRNWRVIIPALILLLLFGFAAVVGKSFFHGLSVVMSDGTEFEYDHNLPRGYESKMISRLEVLQVVAIAYAQRHRGTLPPMQSSRAAFSALRVGLGHEAKHFFQNPATEKPFTPNATLSDWKMGRVSNGGRAILFYDADPPAGYRESYYVTIKGVVGHVPVASLPKRLMASGEN